MKKAVFLLAAVSAFAQANTNDIEKKDVSGFYLGGGIGTTTAFDDGVGTNDLNLISNDSTYKLYGGYQFNRIVAIEAQYTRYGDIYSKDDADRHMVKPESIALMANLGYTFDSGWRPFATVGLGRTELDFGPLSKTETSFRAGVGGEYSPKAIENLNFRVAYEVDSFMFDNGPRDDINIVLGSLYAGVSYKF
ncbi:TPA: outer membrane beta-barrel protein [Vibrio vulnificus]|nr:porin family protein [Vibrio vulnificus]HAS6178118.1 outer membrane beta-barrel protein [Vibrio vulnificus]HAS6209126.1 outer membrane beta-barrel protein [Vibrio vulnificus]HAS6223191.1 outer membrane beta-barrel protein [Vibrio vulnificus]HAS6227380.1 outer membrane beta-barrel protein [Vibrio vulnificus]